MISENKNSGQSSNTSPKNGILVHHDQTQDKLANISSIKRRKESLPSPPATPTFRSDWRRRCSSAQSSIHSVTNLLETSTDSNIRCNHNDGPIYTSTPASAGGTFSSSTSQTSQKDVQVLIMLYMIENIITIVSLDEWGE